MGLGTPFYFRPPQYRYSIRSEPGYGWWTGVTRDERQLLVSLYGTLVFDRRGDLKAVCAKAEYPLPADWRKCPNLADWKVAWPGEVDLEECPIRVRRFWVPEGWLGIEDMPAILAEYFTDPQAFLRRGDVRAEDALAWREEDQFVFHCGCDYFVNGRGEVVAS